MSTLDRLTLLNGIVADQTRWQPTVPIPPHDGVEWEPDAYTAFRAHHFQLPEVMLQAVVWVGSAALSGVLGNVAHELLKSVFARHRESPDGPFGEHDAALIARLAIFAAIVDLDSWPSKIPYQMLKMSPGTFDESIGAWQFRCTAKVEPPIYFIAEVLPGEPPETRVLMEI